MQKPEEGSAVTEDQIKGVLNSNDWGPGTPGKKGWHYGQFEPWALEYGYSDGMPLYGECITSGQSVHIYWLNDGNQGTILMLNGQTPENYGIKPKPA